MLCDNCGKNKANVKYLRNINGVKKEMNLCEECSQKLGITTDLSFDMPIDFSSFLGGFLEDFTNSDFLSLLDGEEELRCKGCNSTFEEIANNGKFGCPECYETFENEIDSILNKIQGSNKHIGRLGKLDKAKVDKIEDDEKNSNNTKTSDSKIKNAKTENLSNNNEDKNMEKLEELKQTLKDLVKEEKYEEAAKIRDEIKKLENKK